jgi:hypothetical protein
MIGYYVPHRVYPAGYHCDPKQPLPFAGLASQKNYMSLYLMCVYGDSEHSRWFRQAWLQTGKKLDMGKACIRFKKLDDLALDCISEAIRRVPAKKYIDYCEAARVSTRERKTKAPGEPGRGARAAASSLPPRRPTKTPRRRKP